MSRAPRRMPGQALLADLRAHGPGWRRPLSAPADELVDPALKLAFFLLAPAQPLLEIGDRELEGRLPAERNTHKVVAPPDDPGEKGTAFSRDGQRDPLLGEPEGGFELEAGAVFGNVADHAIPGRTTFADLGDAAINNLVARAPASVHHRF